MSKFLLKILILVVILSGVGFLSAPKQVQADNHLGKCESGNGDHLGSDITKEDCLKVGNNYPQSIAIIWTSSTPPQTREYLRGGQSQYEPGGTTETEPDKAKTPFETYIKEKFECGITTLYPGCWITGAYMLLYQLPSLLLYFSAYLLNVLLAVTLSSKIFGDSTFISSAWSIVRDLSNIFFILILLYISVKIILGMTGHGIKQMIAKVIVMAFLINFSLFFTGIVIDTGNILALVFYNKLHVETTVDGESRQYSDAAGEKDVAGGMVQAFNATSLLDAEFFQEAGTIYVPGQEPKPGEASAGFTFGIIVVTGLLMLFTAYCFIVAGISFIGRMIELFVLLIFSPFAFMSSALPNLSHAEYIGWDSWLKRLISASFMAPIFMFFLYFIFLLIQSPLFTDMMPGENTSMINRVLQIVIPTLVILVLLLKATEFAKKGSGKFGEVVNGALKVGAGVTGLALGGAALGAAAAGRATLGATAKSVQATEATRMKAMSFKDTRDKWNTMNKANPFAYLGLAGTAITGVHKATVAGVAQTVHATPLGAKMVKAEKSHDQADGAKHELDTATAHKFGGKLGYEKDVKYSQLREDQQEKIREEIDKDFISKKAFGSKYDDIRDPEQKAAIERAYTDLHANRARYLGPDGQIHGLGVDMITRDPNDPNNFTTTRKTIGGFGGEENAALYGASKAMGEFVSALRKGSYDMRNLPDMSAKSKGFPKFGVGTIATVAAGVRLGLKQGAKINYGTPQKDLFKDMGNVITEALKSVKIKIDMGDSHGGGHGGGGGKDEHGSGSGGHH